jgi:hypothetical protein
VILSIEFDDVFRHANGKRGATRKLWSAFAERAETRETFASATPELSRALRAPRAVRDDVSSLTAGNGQGDEQGLECGVGVGGKRVNAVAARFTSLA